MPMTPPPCPAWVVMAWSSPCARSQARSAAVDLEPGKMIQSLLADKPTSCAGLRTHTKRTPGTFFKGWNSSRLLMRG